jgi:hypothetical protein
VGLQQWRVAANIVNKQPRINDKEWSSSLGVGRGANNSSPSDLDDSLDKRPRRRNMDMRFGTWNIRRLYRAGSIMTVSKGLSRYRPDLVGMREVRWEGSGIAPAGEYPFLSKGE